MTEVVYHFTDSMSLPWIISSGELRPGAKRYYTPSRLLWATTCDKGEKTASCDVADEELKWVNADILLVRFKLAGDDFFEWSEITSRCPGWTAEHVAELEDRARDCDDYEVGFSHWRWRAASLPCLASCKSTSEGMGMGRLGSRCGGLSSRRRSQFQFDKGRRNRQLRVFCRTVSP